MLNCNPNKVHSGSPLSDRGSDCLNYESPETVEFPTALKSPQLKVSRRSIEFECQMDGFEVGDKIIYHLGTIHYPREANFYKMKMLNYNKPNRACEHSMKAPFGILNMSKRETLNLLHQVLSYRSTVSLEGTNSFPLSPETRSAKEKAR
ncbi:hypothetical protein RF11_01532 [Thelohanellus kitauei]|uniref:Uncharacterized protein n=1 Tax=Thelohanellus kitauei TaxID=669202 RepID=A0A0C2N4Z6_THEKT|nr:hypothetical protein RF11_01532 [Thelohanellus kitauei]